MPALSERKFRCNLNQRRTRLAYGMFWLFLARDIEQGNCESSYSLNLQGQMGLLNKSSI